MCFNTGPLWIAMWSGGVTLDDILGLVFGGMMYIAFEPYIRSNIAWITLSREASERGGRVLRHCRNGLSRFRISFERELQFHREGDLSKAKDIPEERHDTQSKRIADMKGDAPWIWQRHSELAEGISQEIDNRNDQLHDEKDSPLHNQEEAYGKKNDGNAGEDNRVQHTSANLSSLHQGNRHGSEHRMLAKHHLLTRMR